MQNRVFMSQVLQPLTTPITFFTILKDSAKEPRSKLSRGWDARVFAPHVVQQGLFLIDVKPLGNTGESFIV